MNGDSAVNAVASSAAGRPTVRMPIAYTSGIATAPATNDGARRSSGERSTRVVSHAAAKYSGGVISTSVWTVEITSPNPPDETTVYVASSSPNRLCPATPSRSATPTAVSAATMSMGAHPTRRGCEAAAGEDHR
jgi:hypothetical protein